MEGMRCVVRVHMQGCFGVIARGLDVGVHATREAGRWEIW